ncbi:MAG: ferrous iron transporter B [Victivallales bacterium]|nr:ferrous iron transporter B [Victivallales bacterium]
MAIKIALAGNPNCGKTTLFNELTGSNQYVGNWPGVTVEKKDGQLKGHKDVIIQDLPGIYSLSPYTLEEVVSRRYLVNDKPDAIINIIDGTNIERNLYLTTQLLELNIPTVIAVNMMDLVKKNGDEIQLDKLGKTLGCIVVPISALNGDGCRDIAEKALEAAKSGNAGEHPHVFSGSVEHAIAHIEESLDKKVDSRNLRWFSVKIFERDEKVLEELKLSDDLMSHLEEHIKDCEKEMDDDAESIITNQRYAYIKKVVSQTVKKKAPVGSLTMSDKIDQVVTNRVLALPIFAVIIWFMYWISVSTVGTWLTDWANDGVFGDGWFVAWTQDSSLFTSKEVKERNAAAEKAFDAKAALAEKKAEITAANDEAKAAWQLEAAQAWAKGEEAPEEPEYEDIPKDVEFEPETWDSVSGDFEDASLRVEKFEEAYTKAVEENEEFVKEAEEASKEAAELVAKATARLTDAQDKEQAALYVKLLQEDAKEKAELLAAAKAVAEDLAKKEDKADDKAEESEEEEFKIDYPELAKCLKVPVYFEDEESGEIENTEIVDYEAYLENKKAAAEENEPDPSKYGLWIPGIPGLVEAALDKMGAGDFIKSLILDGIIGGVGTVFGFLPQILIVFLFLAFLEDCGYMARVAFIMDRIFRRFGLSGKSFIPMLVGTGCGVPGVLATRTIENDKDRRMTIILATFLPCGAKVAIIAMIVAAFFPQSNLVGPSMYFIGIAIVVLGGIALKKTKVFAGEVAPFVMELPAYHMPSFKGVLIHTWERGKAYAIKAGTIIFAACIVLWLLMHFDWTFTLLDPKSAEGLEQCMLHDIGQCFAWIFQPLGFGNWQGAVACVSAEIAKEQATATLALLSPDVAGGTLKGIQALFMGMVPEAITDPAMRTIYAKLIAFSFMVCNLFFPPCLVAIAATWREMGSAKWGCIAIGFQLLIGYFIALVSFRMGALFFAGASFGLGQIVAVLAIVGVLVAVFRPAPKQDLVK